MDSMFCWPVDSEEIRQLIYNLKISKSPGYDNIGASLIKDVVEGLVRPLADIYNLSIETGIFHENLKIAKVIPAYTKGDACMASNYRPISLLSVFDSVCSDLTPLLILNCSVVLYLIFIH